MYDKNKKAKKTKPEVESTASQTLHPKNKPLHLVVTNNNNNNSHIIVEHSEEQQQGCCERITCTFTSLKKKKGEHVQSESSALTKEVTDILIDIPTELEKQALRLGKDLRYQAPQPQSTPVQDPVTQPQQPVAKNKIHDTLYSNYSDPLYQTDAIVVYRATARSHPLSPTQPVLLLFVRGPCVFQQINNRLILGRSKHRPDGIPATEQTPRLIRSHVVPTIQEGRNREEEPCCCLVFVDDGTEKWRRVVEEEEDKQKNWEDKNQDQHLDQDHQHDHEQDHEQDQDQRRVRFAPDDRDEPEIEVYAFEKDEANSCCSSSCSSSSCTSSCSSSSACSCCCCCCCSSSSYSYSSSEVLQQQLNIFIEQAQNLRHQLKQYKLARRNENKSHIEAIHNAVQTELQLRATVEQLQQEHQTQRLEVGLRISELEKAQEKNQELKRRIEELKTDSRKNTEFLDQMRKALKEAKEIQRNVQGNEAPFSPVVVLVGSSVLIWYFCYSLFVLVAFARPLM